MLHKIRLHNFRTYLNAEIDLTRRHLIIGRNNSGKTNLCAALGFLCNTAYRDLAGAAQVVPGGIGEITNGSFDSNVIEISCRCELVFEGRSYFYDYGLKLSLDSSSGPGQPGQPLLRVLDEELTIDGADFAKVTLLKNDGQQASMLHEEDYVRKSERREAETRAPRDATMLSKLYELETNRRAILFRTYLSLWQFFSLSPTAMRTMWSESKDVSAGLQPTGGNLAAALYRLKNRDERSYRRVIDQVQMIEPDLEAVNFLVAPDQPPVPFVDIRNRPRASWVGLSDGTLRCLALAFISEAVAGQVDQSGQHFAPLVVIEEPENGIYPGLMRAFFDQLEDRGREAQYVFTSHSPYFINLFDAYRESVTLFRRRNETTEIVEVPPADGDPERLLLAEEYSMELFD